jgi:hypothetical protein
MQRLRQAVKREPASLPHRTLLALALLKQGRTFAVSPRSTRQISPGIGRAIDQQSESSDQTNVSQTTEATAK